VVCGAHFAWRFALRERLYPEPYYRLIYGESDGLPGLVVDRFGKQCVAQIGTAGMELLKSRHSRRPFFEVLECEGLLFKNDSGGTRDGGTAGLCRGRQGVRSTSRDSWSRMA